MRIKHIGSGGVLVPGSGIWAPGEEKEIDDPNIVEPLLRNVMFVEIDESGDQVEKTEVVEEPVDEPSGGMSSTVITEPTSPDPVPNDEPPAVDHDTDPTASGLGGGLL